MRVVLDTCVVVDVLQNREPFCHDAQELFLLCANRQFEGLITAKSMTDIYYLVHRQTHSDKQTREIIKNLCVLFPILDTAGLDIQNAITSDISDYEDAVMAETAVRSKADYIVTRNEKDYVNAPLPVYTPKALLALLEKEMAKE